MTIHCFSDLLSGAAMVRASQIAADLKPYANALAGSKRLSARTGMTASQAVLADVVSAPTTYAQLAWAGEANAEMSHAMVLRADPVHYLVRRNAMTLVPLNSAASLPDSLTLDEARALGQTLNKHFAADGLTIHVADSTRWYITSERPLEQQPQLVSLRDASGLPVFDCMPTREAAASGVNWAGLGNEVQMLLHEHPVNIEREQRGGFAVNAIWFWGGDEVKPSSTVTPARVICFDDFHLPTIRGACKRSGLREPLIDFEDLQALKGNEGLHVLETSCSDIVVRNDAKALFELAQQQASRVAQLRQLAQRMRTSLIIHQCPVFATGGDADAQNSEHDSTQLAYAVPSYEFDGWSRFRFWARHDL
jgi:hypothetical protein